MLCVLQCPGQPTTKNCLIQKVSSAEVDKPCFAGSVLKSVLGCGCHRLYFSVEESKDSLGEATCRSGWFGAVLAVLAESSCHRYPGG